MKNNFKKMGLPLAALLCVLLALGFLFLYKKTESYNERANELARELAGKVIRHEEIRSLSRSLEAIKGETTLLESHFARPSDIVPFLGTIESLSRKASVTAEVDSVDTLNEGSALVLQVNASGSFVALHKFLMLLENSPYGLEFMLIDLRKVTEPNTGAAARTKNTGGGGWRAVIGIKLLSFVP